jgi:REP element-mobilizing transposase RayT
MARHLRVEFQGAIYHVTCRMLGDAKSCLFIDDADRERFLERLSERVEQYNIRLYMFVLMTNHFHLVFETPEGNCSKFMQSLSTAYTVYYNLRHQRHGHLFDGRYKAKLVEGDDYLLALTRYVHLNPVHVSTIKNQPLEDKIRYLRQYPWSTYQSYIGKRKALPYVEYMPILGEMSGKEKDWPKRYREFVESGLAETDEELKEALKESPRSIGGDGFRAWVDELYQKLIEKSDAPEDISFRRITEPLNPDIVLAAIADVFEVEEEEFRRRKRSSPLRAAASRYLIKYAGMSQREVAVFLDAGSGTAINKHLQRYSEAFKKDRRLRRLLKKIEQRLEEERCAQRTDGKL